MHRSTQALVAGLALVAVGLVDPGAASAKSFLNPAVDPIRQCYQTEGSAPYSMGALFTIDDNASGFRSFSRSVPQLAPGTGDVAVEVETSVDPGSVTLDGDRSGVAILLDEGADVGRQIRAEFIQRSGNRSVGLVRADNTVTDGIAVDWTGTIHLRLERRGDLGVLSVAGLEHAAPLAALAPSVRASPTFEFGAFSGAGRARVDFAPIDLRSPLLPEEPPDWAPTANAGADQQTLEGLPVALDGTGSCDGDGDDLALQWVQTAGPAVTLDHTDPAQPEFVAPEVPAGGGTVLAFQLTAHDGIQGSPPDTVQVVVGELVADAGPDRDVPEATGVLLPEVYTPPGPYDELLTYRWEQLAGPAVRLCKPDVQQLAFTAPLVGPSGATLSFRITVTSGQVAATDTVDVTVADGPHPGEARILLDPTCDPLSQGYQTEGGAHYAIGPRLRIDDANNDRRVFLLHLPEAETGSLAVEANVRLEGSVILDGEDTGVHFVLTGGEGGDGTAIRAAAIQRGTERRFALKDSGSSFTAGVASDWTTSTRLRIERTAAGEGVLTTDLSSEVLPSGSLTAATRVQPTFEFGTVSGPATTLATFGPIVAHSPLFGAPITHAGRDQSVGEGALVSLDGSGSHDPGGDALTYLWEQVAGPAVELDLGDPVHPTFVAPPVPAGGATLTFQLTVSDGTLVGEPDFVDVTVGNLNRPPVARASAEPLVGEGAPVTLDGTASFDPDADPLSFEWRQILGPAVSLTGTNTSQASFTAPPVGPEGDTLTFELRVSDGVASATALVQVVIENQNHAPTAVAGADSTVDEGSLVTLDGRASTDPDGDALQFAWTQTSGPAVALAGAAGPTPSFTAPAVSPGGASLEFEMAVEDGLGGSATDTVAVLVRNVNDPPTCEAARAFPRQVWPPNHRFHPVLIRGVSDPDGRRAHVRIEYVQQDEPVQGQGAGHTSPDAILLGPIALVRAERQGGGNGRVYHIGFTADDQQGGVCSGEVVVGVPAHHGQPAVDDEPLYDSTER